MPQPPQTRKSEHADPHEQYNPVPRVVLGLVLALVVLQMLESGFNLLGISSYLTMALWGAVLILFIALQNRKA